MTVGFSEVVAVIMLIFNTIGVVVLLKKFVWDTKKQQNEQRTNWEQRDRQIKDWICEAIAQQNAHCTLLSQMSIEGVRRDDLFLKEKQKEQAEEIKELKTFVARLNGTLIQLTEEIKSLKDAIKEMKEDKK